MITFSEFNCCNELLIFTSNQAFISVWQWDQLESFGLTDRQFQATASAPSWRAWHAANHIICGVCETGCVGAVARAPGVQTRSLDKQEFALMKVALELKSYKGFYNFHNWDSRGFLIYHSLLPAELFLKKSACYTFFHIPTWCSWIINTFLGLQ